MALIGDFFRSVGQMADRKFLWVMAKALGLTLLLLAGMGWLAVWLVGLLPTSLGDWPWIGPVELPTAALQGLTVVGLIFASSFLMIPVAAIFVGFFLEEIADAVEIRHYPFLGPARDIPFGEMIGTAVKFLAVVIGVNLLALIPYLVVMLISGPGVLLLAWAVNGYLLGREYFELVAVRRISPREMATLRAANSGRTWFAGFLMAAALTIPIMNLLIPVLGVATITHQFHRLWGGGEEQGDRFV